MSELKEIASVILKHLSDALLSAAHELSKQNKSDPIIATANRESVSLEVGVHVVFELKKGKRFGGTVTKIDGDLVEVVNKVIGKIWVIHRSSILDISTGDFYYK